MDQFRRICAGIAACGSALLCQPLAAAPVLEPIYTAHLGSSGFTLRVKSNGCTNKDSFRFEVERHSDQTELRLLRTRPDRCRALLVEGVTLHWDWAEIGLSPDEPVTLLNPMMAQASD